MKKQLRRIFFIALLTGTGIVLFQLYWLYSAYRLNAASFQQTASDVLQHTVDEYLMQVIGPGTKEHVSGKPFFVITPGTNNTSTRTVDMPANEQHLLQLMMASFLFQTMGRSASVDTLQHLYAHALAQRHIYLPATLSIDDTINNPVVASMGFVGPSSRIGARFKNRDLYLLGQTLAPLIVSLLLVLLTAGCLWYMWRIIWRQKQLDDIKNDFINNMTHELKTPVAILKTTHEALYKFGGIDDKEKALRYLKANHEELDKLEKNIERILDITSYERGARQTSLQAVNVHLLIGNIVKRFSANEQVHIRFQHHLADNIQTDAAALESILLNLIDNAIKYNDKANKEVIIIADNIPDGWRLSVQDNGPGISAKEQAFIFDKFYRIPSGNVHDVKGFGLGLSYVKQLVQLLNGSIRVVSDVTGATFIIEFSDHGKN
jgi:two-component system, OmpR family, phosphate regulon sensor histidine kinase PhoR